MSGLVESIAEIRRVAQEWRQRSDAELARVIRAMPDLDLADFVLRSSLIGTTVQGASPQMPATSIPTEAATSTANPTRHIGRTRRLEVEGAVRSRLRQGPATWAELRGTMTPRISVGTLSRILSAPDIERSGTHPQLLYHLVEAPASGSQVGAPTTSSPRGSGPSRGSSEATTSSGSERRRPSAPANAPTPIASDTGATSRRPSARNGASLGGDQ